MDWQDDEFETFLRQFKPRPPKALPDRRRRFVAFAAAAVVLLAIVIPMRSLWKGAATSDAGPSPGATPPTRNPDRRDVRLTPAVNRIPQVEVTLAAYRPANASDQQVNVTLPAAPPRKALIAPKPMYPSDAQRLGLDGIVELRLTVSPSGNVTTTERRNSFVDLHPDKENAAERAEYYTKNPYAFALEAERTVKEWQFEPGPSVMTVVVSFAFSLKEPLSGLPTLPPVKGLPRPGPALAPLPITASGRPGNRRLTVGGAIKPPTRLVNVTPVYPEEAKAAGIHGVVVIQIVIGEDGSVVDAQVLRSIPQLDQAALDAVYQWKYEPTLLNGEPVELEMNVTINFTLS